MTELKVKQLEWSPHGEAKGGGAKYNVYEVGSRGVWNCVCYPHEDTQYRIAEGVSEEEAKSAAQADCAQRVWSMIEPTEKRPIGFVGPKGFEAPKAYASQFANVITVEFETQEEACEAFDAIEAAVCSREGKMRI